MVSQMRVIKGYGCIFLLVGGATPILVLVLLVVLGGVVRHIVITIVRASG
jgi:hypothetical protein